MSASTASGSPKRSHMFTNQAPFSLAAAYEERHLPVQVAAAAGHVDEIVSPQDTRERLAELLT